jgi:hypothetical protein
LLQNTVGVHAGVAQTQVAAAFGGLLFRVSQLASCPLPLDQLDNYLLLALRSLGGGPKPPCKRLTRIGERRPTLFLVIVEPILITRIGKGGIKLAAF